MPEASHSTSSDGACSTVKSSVLCWSAVFVISLALTSGIGTVFSKVLSAKRAPDYLNYYRPFAQSLLAGRGMTTPAGNFSTRTAPGYPLFLAGVFRLADALRIERETVVIAILVLLHALTAVMVGGFAGRLWTRKAAVVAAILWTTYPLALWLIPMAISETPYIPILLGAMMLFWISISRAKISYGVLLVSGLCLGMAMLFRPSALPFPLAVAVILLSRTDRAWRQRVAATSVFLGAVVIAILPWEIYAYGHCGQVVPITSVGPASIVDGLTYATPDRIKDDSPAVPVWVPNDVGALMADLRAKSLAGEMTSSRDVHVWLFEQAKRHPLALAKLVGLKVVRCWYATDSHRWELAILIIQLPYLGLALAGGISMWRKGGRQRQLAVLVVLVVLCNWMMTIMVVSMARYMVPIAPFLLLLVPAAWNAREVPCAVVRPS